MNLPQMTSRWNQLFKEGAILSGAKLFSQRQPLDRTVPQRGGAKEYAPDGNWLQGKRLEKFYEERKDVLSEARAERLGGLVVGEWNPDEQLVEFKKEMKKFWTHMGFVDNSRKWLYPEEALFLMETNVLEVWYRGLPLSLQEAYRAFLAQIPSLEEYQVYAHLRRLGYVVIRHQGRCDITFYEHKIKLDQHVSSKKRKLERKTKEKMSMHSELDVNESNSVEKFRTDTESDSVSTEKKLCLDKTIRNLDERSDESNTMEVNTDNHPDMKYSKKLESGFDQNSNSEIGTGDKLSLESDNNMVCDTDVDVCNADLNIASSGIFQNPNSYPKSDNAPSIPYSVWDFSDGLFPDIGDCDSVKLSKPRQGLLPENMDIAVEPYEFDARAYKIKCGKQAKKQSGQYGMRGAYLDEMEFSYANMIEKQKVKARNWGEYKQMMSEAKPMSSDDHDVQSPVAHLWADEVTPLVRPEEAFSTGCILSKLQVIENEKLTKNQNRLVESVKDKVVYDVYLPDAKFKKTQPGIPNHRVCVVRSTDPPPSLATVVGIQTALNDQVPLNWAVVDEGDIAFYSFADICLPIDINVG